MIIIIIIIIIITTIKITIIIEAGSNVFDL